MKKGVNKRLLSVLGSLILLAFIAGGFFWLWGKTQSPASIGNIDEKYKTIEIESIKSKADSILQPTTRDNLSGMPMTSPTADLLSRENPFASL